MPRETWEAVQRRLSGRGRRTKTSPGRLPFGGGLLRCGHCGAAVTGLRIRKRGQVHVYYVCSRRLNGKGCPESASAYLTADAVEAQLGDWIRDLRLPDDALPMVRAALDESDHRARAEAARRIAELRARQDKLRRRLEVAYEERLEGRLTGAEYDARAAEWREELSRLADELAALERADASRRDDTLRVFEWARDAAKLWEVATPDEKRELLDIVSLNRSVRDGRVVAEWAEPFDVITSAASADRAGGMDDEARASVSWWAV